MIEGVRVSVVWRWVRQRRRACYAIDYPHRVLLSDEQRDRLTSARKAEEARSAKRARVADNVHTMGLRV